MSDPQSDLPGTRRDLHDLCMMFADARSFAFVGNAGSILEFENGALIDSYDVVVRFNRATTAGSEHKVGSRTDILCANVINTLERAPSPAETLRPRCVVQFAHRGPKELDAGRIEAFRAWVGDVPLVVTLPPDLIGLTPHARTRQLTHGTYALYAFTKLFRIERLFLTGFTMFAPVAGMPLKQYEPNRHKVGLDHDLDVEAELFCEIVRRCPAELTATPEVEELLVRHGAGRGKPPMARDPYTRGLEWLAWAMLKGGFKLRRVLEAQGHRMS